MRDGIGVMRCAVDAEVTDEFPRLRLWAMYAEVPTYRGSRRQRTRLEELGDRVRDFAIGGLRTDRIATSYRMFARQIGLDPDTERNPLEQAAFERLAAGRFVSRSRLADALVIAMLETGVPLWTVDAGRTHGWLRIGAGPDGVLSVNDQRRRIAPLMRPPAAEIAPAKGTRRAVVYAVGVHGVPDGTVEETFWHVQASIREEDP